ncbi:hypothetical protein ACQP0C_27225 [Nocardia sp. CA-129566]|uniref:hypothetical protein n=1 Tax=Nocardia sp. CA-129566 TaxID=3239976 RepID=UPI003D985A42
MVPGTSDRDLLLTLGRHEELTGYVAAAIQRIDPDPESTLFGLARGVDGWGRIEIVEMLAGTTRVDIQDWLVRTGFRNTIMYEYLAGIAATTGHLLDRLRATEPDDELIDSAADIISALIRGGPTIGIHGVADAPQLVEVMLDILERRGRRPAHFVVVEEIDDFLRYLDDETGSDHDWPQQTCDRLMDTCRRIMDQGHWPALAAADLAAQDRQKFWAAEHTARALGMETFDAQMRRLRTGLDWSWSAVMELADDARIDSILALAEHSFPLDTMATGALSRLDPGPLWRMHTELGSIVACLGKFHGRGWSLIAVGLRSPLPRVRLATVTTLNKWPSHDWPTQAADHLRAAASVEPDDRIRRYMEEVLAHPGPAILQLRIRPRRRSRPRQVGWQ